VWWVRDQHTRKHTHTQADSPSNLPASQLAKRKTPGGGLARTLRPPGGRSGGGHVVASRPHRSRRSCRYKAMPSAIWPSGLPNGRESSRETRLPFPGVPSPARWGRHMQPRSGPPLPTASASPQSETSARLQLGQQLSLRLRVTPAEMLVQRSHCRSMSNSDSHGLRETPL